MGTGSSLGACFLSISTEIVRTGGHMLSFQLHLVSVSDPRTFSIRRVLEREVYIVGYEGGTDPHSSMDGGLQRNYEEGFESVRNAIMYLS